MLKSLNRKFLTLLLSSTIIVSCSTSIDNISNMSTKLNDKKSFGIKSNPLVGNADLTYSGEWSVIGNRKQSTGAIDNKDSSLIYKGNWSSSNNSLATESNYAYTPGGGNITLANDTDTAITYIKNNWTTSSIFKYNNISNSKYEVTNKEVDINKIKYINNGTPEAWSNSMNAAWVTGDISGVSYTKSENSSSQIEIPFSGTNIQVYQFKSTTMGQCKIEVYNSGNELERDLTVDNYNDGDVLSKTSIVGLANGSHKLVIKGIDNNKFNFVKAESLASIEYEFNKDNIVYNALKSKDSGKVAVTLDNNPATTQIIDLYFANNSYQDVFSKEGLSPENHKITIDALGEKNNSSSGYKISLNEFTERQSVEGNFSGTNLNLKLLNTSSSGKANLYIDGVFNKEIDMYNISGALYYSVNISGLSDTSHKFKIYSKNEKNPASSGTRLNFDGYTTNKASYTFNGVGIKYFADKNNDQGKVDIWIDGSKYGTYDLYSKTLQDNQEIVSITGLVNGSHTIDIIPAGVKYGNSSNYSVNVNHLKVIKPKIITFYNDYNKKIYTATSDGSAEPKLISGSFSAYNYYPQISGDGSIVVFKSIDEKIYTAPSDGSSEPKLISGTLSYNYYPKISGDGSIVTWYSNNDSGKSKIYTAPSDGNSELKLISSNFDTHNHNPQISVDGNIVTWRTYDYNTGKSKIYTAPSDGITEPKLISGSLNYSNYPQISGDGNIVTWTCSIAGLNKIYTAPSNGSSEPKLISGSLNNNDAPQISRNGSIVTWHSDIAGVNKIYTAPSDGSSEPKLISGSLSGTSQNSKINEDGNIVVWNNGWNGSFKIYTAPSDGSSEPKLISGNLNDSNNMFPVISGDGSIVTWPSEGKIYTAPSDGSTEPKLISGSLGGTNYEPQISD